MAVAPPSIHVVAAVLEDERGRVLIAQRPPGKSLAGAWEFPGGKLKAGEGRLEALARELHEELGIELDDARPLIHYRHRYPELEVELDAWRVTRWRGEPYGREGQAIDWQAPAALMDYGLLPADAPILNALRLPPLVLVTPPAAPAGEGAFLDALEASVAGHRASAVAGRELPLAAGCDLLVVLRRPDLDPADLLELAAGAACRLDGSGAQLLLHGDPQVLGPLLREPPAPLRVRLAGTLAGLHSPAWFLSAITGRPPPREWLFGVSCHDAAELAAAQAAGADYAFLGNLKPSASHPGRPGIGWDAFAAGVADLSLPVYAIGGLGPADLEDAWAAGAQGVAAIRGLWF